MSKQKCANCRYWLVKPGEDVTGACRRYPPTFHHEAVSRHPVTSEGQWCGEWVDAGLPKR